MRNVLDFEETEKYGLRKGMVFYFDDLINAEAVSSLEEILDHFLLMTRREFTQKRGGNDYVSRRTIRGGWRKVFHREFDGKDFMFSQVLTLDNVSPRHLQTIYASIKLSNYRNPGVNSLCSSLYFQCPLDTDWTDVYPFVEDVNRRLNVRYASAGYEMAFNILYYPGSMGYGTRALRNLNYVNSEETEWQRLGASGKMGIPCPNFIQALCADWAKKIDAKSPHGICAQTKDGSLFLDILDHSSGRMREPPFEEAESRFRRLYHLLKPLLVLPERTRYMKKEDWEKRLNRFAEIEIHPEFAEKP